MAEGHKHRMTFLQGEEMVHDLRDNVDQRIVYANSD